MKTTTNRFAIPILSLLILIAVCVVFTSTITKYLINNAIDSIPGYTGGVSAVSVNLLKGTIDVLDLKLNKVEADNEIPFVEVVETRAGIQWTSLMRGEFVGVVDVVEPTLNFAKGKSRKGDQFGTNVDWLGRIKALAPIQINRITITHGKIRYLDQFSSPQVSVSLDDFDLLSTNIRNVLDKNIPLPSTLKINASVNSGGTVRATGKFNLLRQLPNLDFDAKVENVNVTGLNDFLRAYVNIDAEGGSLNLYTEVAMRNGILNGYLKPLITDLKILDLSEDDDQPLKLLWEGFVSVVATIFENQKKDKIGVKVPIQGDFSQPEVEVIPTLASLFRNAFIKALENETDGNINLQSVDQ